jgi:hypothetical protein
LRRALVLCLPSVAILGLFAACGSRTGLLVPEEEPTVDASPDRIVLDATHEPDAGLDAEAGFDAPVDVQFRDVPVLDICPDAGSTLVYVLAEDNTLLSFYPPTLGFNPIGTLACPTKTAGASPFSMAVDRRGIAYSVFTDGELFRVDTASAACEATKFPPDQSGFMTFGMGFTANTGDAGETLFVAEATATPAKPNSLGLASIDTTSYALHVVGGFIPPIPGPELTGTSDGRLFAFFTTATIGSNIDELDKTNASVIADHPLQVGSPDDAYAFAFWGGDFWVFTSPGGPTTVTRYDPTSGTETTATTYAGTIVGAGVSTCAPQ